ncbi:hypothetical protein Tco_0314335, partial [Tanacetum coccineum]
MRVEVTRRFSNVDIIRRKLRGTSNIFVKIPSSIQNVEPDGNCGFRSVALGLGHPEDYWPRIRWAWSPEECGMHTKAILHLDGETD